MITDTDFLLIVKIMMHETLDESIFEEDLKSFPISDRFARFAELMRAYFCGLNADMGQNQQFDFSLKMLVRKTGSHLVTSVVGTGHTLERTAEHIALDGIDDLLLVGNPMGKLSVETEEGTFLLCGDDLALIDFSKPFSLNSDQQAFFGLTMLKVSRTAIVSRVANGENALNSKMFQDPFLGILLKEAFNVLAREGMSSEFPQYGRLVGTFLDIVAMSLDASLVGERNFELRDSHSGLRLAIQRFIDSNLRNPELDHELIARQFGISVRQVHKVFEGKGLTVGQYILNRRLQGAAAQLRAIDHAHRKIGDIAFDWCFNELSHFSRAFKSHYGCTAREWRHELRHN